VAEVLAFLNNVFTSERNFQKPKYK
jgi:hypothetical protein